MVVDPTAEIKPYPSPWYCVASGQGVMVRVETEDAL